MCYYDIMGELTGYIEDRVNEGLDSFLEKYEEKDNYLLIYPLLNIELGAMSAVPESLDNLLNRCVVGFVYKYFITKQKTFSIQPIDAKELEIYRNQVNPQLTRIFQDYRLYREIKVGNAVSSAKLEKRDINKYQLITSLVSNKYKEENFYFYGFDNTEQARNEKDIISKGHSKFAEKYAKAGYEDLLKNKFEETIDVELLTYCKYLVMKDLSKWNGNVRSAVFKNIDELCDVIGFLYYLSFLRSLRARIISNQIGVTKYIYDILLMQYEKAWLIAKISDVTGRHINKVTQIINYLINEGGANVLEFPLFQVGNYIITVPSIIMVNDWQFTIINGHHVKGIDIANRQKTISSITEDRIHKLLSKVQNVLLAKEKYYEYIDDSGAKKNSDIDYAIYDLQHNKMLVIEAKWKDNHYYDEIDESYVKIEKTVNDVFGTQISNHKVFLSKEGSLEYLFDNDEQLNDNSTPPDIFYLAVDKRSQFHKNGNHMISEYMLLYFLNSCISGNGIDLRILIDEIFDLETKVEYIKSDSNFNEYTLDNGYTILIEKHELCLDYKF